VFHEYSLSLPARILSGGRVMDVKDWQTSILGAGQTGAHPEIEKKRSR